jgi:hypothetical protein
MLYFAAVKLQASLDGPPTQSFPSSRAEERLLLDVLGVQAIDLGLK